MQKERLSRLGRNGKEKDVVKLSCFPGPCRTGENRVSRFFVSDGRSSVRSKIGRCRITTLRQNTFYYNSRCGFTLIELLVVILIIGILAAVALPQYQKAVEKSKSIQGISLVKTFGQAAQAYYIANGTNPASINDLDVSLSETQQMEFVCPGGIQNACDKKEWGIALYNGANVVTGVIAWRTSGPYKGGGFAMYYETEGAPSLSAGTLYCIERRSGPNAIATARTYCPQIIKATGAFNAYNSDHYVMN